MEKVDSHDGAFERPQRSAARRVKKRSASKTDRELKVALTEHQPLLSWAQYTHSAGSRRRWPNAARADAI